MHKNGVKNGSEDDWATISEDFETLVVSGTCQPDQFSSKCLSVPIVNSVSYVMPGPESMKMGNSNHYEYGRYGNPTRNILENCLAKLEGSKFAQTFASGSSAVNAVIETLNCGDHFISTRLIYGGSYGIMENSRKFGFEIDFTNSGQADDILKLVKSNTKLVYIESPSNPTLEILDIRSISQALHQRNPAILLVIDNTFLTPIFQRPLDLGADACIYSCTKYLGGHGDLIMGLVTTNNDDFFKKLHYNQDGRGAIPSPFDCFLLMRSLKTLPLRMTQHMKNGLKVAAHFEGHPKIEKVLHPGLKSHPQHELALKQQAGHSGIFGFYLKGGLKESAAFLDSLKMIKRAASLGSDVSLACIPSKISHIFIPEDERKLLGITDNYVRISIGLENPQVIINDIEQALKLAYL